MCCSTCKNAALTLARYMRHGQVVGVRTAVHFAPRLRGTAAEAVEVPEIERMSAFSEVIREIFTDVHAAGDAVEDA